MMEELLHSSASETRVRRTVDCVVQHTVERQPVDIRNKNFTGSQLEQLAAKRVFVEFILPLENSRASSTCRWR